MKKYYSVTIWTKESKLISYNFEKIENAIIFASQEKENFHSLNEESFCDIMVK